VLSFTAQRSLITADELVTQEKRAALSPVRRPGNASPAAPGRKPAETPSGWGSPARSPRSDRRESGADGPPAAYAPSATATDQSQTPITKTLPYKVKKSL